jgi:geranylgeranylglycerol-phosphate geranylgeranyltransferase
MDKPKALYQLMRLDHGLMIIIAILIGSVIAQRVAYHTVGLPPLDKIILAFGWAFFLAGSIYALNDYCDREIDIVNKRTDRPLVRGDLSPTTPLLLFFLFFPLSFFCAWFVNATCFGIAVITGLIAVLYDLILKKIKVIGNFFIAYTMAIPFLFGGAAVVPDVTFSLNIPMVVYLIAGIAFLTGVGREIMLDSMDVSGDSTAGVVSFPTLIGVRRSNILTALFFILAGMISYLPYLLSTFPLYYQNTPFLALLVFTSVFLGFTIVQLLFNARVNLRFHRSYTLGAMFIGLLAFLIGAFLG